jgi:hypothetical protein
LDGILVKTATVKLTYLLGLSWLAIIGSASAQPSAFTYQGQLSVSGQAGNGLYDARFTLHTASLGGSQVGSPVVVAPLGVTNGLFTATLDFGGVAFDGANRWLEIGIRTNGSVAAYTILNPRQFLAATPYAIRAAQFSGTLAATNLTGKISDTNLSVNVALLTNTAVFTRSVVATNFIGSGLGLTNLPATSLVGTLPDARLSANVPLLNAATNAFQGTIGAMNFYGHGGGLTNVPGFIYPFVPTANNIQAFANYGYLATNPTAPVVVTLPLTTNIAVGATVRVTGGAAGGWIVAQNAGQSILVANLIENPGVNWTSSGGSLIWKAIAASADGSRLVAAVQNGGIYTSTDFGATWVLRSAAGNPRNWSSVATSADGMKLVAVTDGSFIYTSTDSGTNWSQRSSSRNYKGVASSLDGTRLFAVATQGGFVSIDSGANWSQVLTAATYSAAASSGNGSNLVAVVLGGVIGTSTNGGATWTPRESNRSWTCVASSVDGSTLVAGANSGANFLYVSTDYGVSWLPGNLAGNWSGVACSANGARVIAVANGSGVYVSQDTGVTWLQRGNLPTAITYNGAACSGDGATMAAVAAAHPIYVSSKTSTTTGVTGQLIGSRLAAVELQHIGNGVFMPISSSGTIRAK